MSSLNKIILIGKVEDTPDIKATSAGDSVANFTLAVERPLRNDSVQTYTDRVKIVAWRDLADKSATLQSGTLALVEGNIHTRSYDNDAGQRVYVTEVEARQVRALASSDLTGFQSAPVADSVNEASAHVIEEKKVDDASDFSFLDDSSSLNAPQGDLQKTPDFGSQAMDEDIPF